MVLKSVRVEIDESLWLEARSKGINQGKKASQVIEEALKLWVKVIK